VQLGVTFTSARDGRSHTMTRDMKDEDGTQIANMSTAHSGPETALSKGCATVTMPTAPLGVFPQ
jgi:hypothetical protein